MKKLMIAAAIVCAAAMSQAASYTWAAKSSYTYLPETTTKVPSATAYLFNAATQTQADLVDYFAANKSLDTSKAISGAAATMTDGQVKTTDQFTYNQAAGVTQWDAYFAMIVDDKLYISSAKTDIAVPTLDDPTPISIGSQSTPSKAAAKMAADGYNGAGWYTAVPEPTSGLLLLLGVAGLALRRRRA